MPSTTREAQRTRYWLTPAGCLAAGGHTVVAGVCGACCSRPEGSGNPGVTGAQPDEPASQAGRPASGGAS